MPMWKNTHMNTKKKAEKMQGRDCMIGTCKNLPRMVQPTIASSTTKVVAIEGWEASLP